MTEEIKKQFPLFREKPDLVYLDSGATALKPQRVIAAVEDYYRGYSANIHRGVYAISEEATEKYEEARRMVADFIGAKEGEIVFTSGTTDSVNKLARSIESWFEAGDEIVVTEMEHHSNLVPWQELARRRGLRLRFIPVNTETFELDLRRLPKLINEKTRLLAITQVSNVLGTVNPVKKIAAEAKKLNPRVMVLADGAQAVAHERVNVKDLGVDFYVFSGHKMYGPTGVGVLWAKEKWLSRMEPFNFGGGMIREVTKSGASWAEIPQRFEGGTPPIAEVIGLSEAVKFILGIGFSSIVEQENRTIKKAVSNLKKISGVEIMGKGEGGIVSFTVAGVHPHDISSIMDRMGVAVRSGHHCAQVLHEVLGIPATTRMSVGVYNSVEDIDRFIEGIRQAQKIFRMAKV